MVRIYATTDGKVSEREIRNMSTSRKIACQGMVLLENKGILPLRNNIKRIALYGNGARNTVKGGTGSGDVNSRFVINVEEGFKQAGVEITTESWLNRYEQTVAEAEDKYYENIKKIILERGEGAILEIFNNPFRAPVVIDATEEELKPSGTDTAVYVLARNSGEGRDRQPEAGDYELAEGEKKLIRELTVRYRNVIIILNVGGVIDTKFFRNTPGIGAVLVMSQAGNIGGSALVDVLYGKETPSGHLTTTWAENYSDYPNAFTFGRQNGDVDDEYYEEGIYVGYRYFDTFNVTPAYPFGYGSSYTTFAVSTLDVRLKDDQVEITIQVKNNGSIYSGREVVQVYYSAPSGIIEKPYQELVAFKKSQELYPGEIQCLKLYFEVSQMAAYDDKKAAYILEKGTYYIRVGTHSRNTHVVAGLQIEEQVITKQLRNLMKPETEIRTLSSAGAISYSYLDEQIEMAACPKMVVSPQSIFKEKVEYSKENAEIPLCCGKEKITAEDVRDGRYTVEELVSQLTIKELATLCVGTDRSSSNEVSVIGASSSICPGAAGDTTSLMIQERNIRNMVMADGPAGLRLSKKFMADCNGRVIPGTEQNAVVGFDRVRKQPEPMIPEDAVQYYQYCTAIPIATLLAQTWDMEAVEVAGDIVGGEMKEFGVTLWLAPGMNIHRNPLCGRNFEYYSEDPFLSGRCAAAETKGVQKHGGIGTTIKHFAMNNQEDNRMHTNAHVSERAIREIYLKGFEIAVRESQPKSMMTSYNLINGVHAANNHDMLTSIARDEWGFDGIIMTDWGTTGSIEMEPDKQFRYGSSDAALCIKAGNDLIMPGCKDDVDKIISAVKKEEGSVTKADLQACAVRILRSIFSSAIYDS